MCVHRIDHNGTHLWSTVFLSLHLVLQCSILFLPFFPCSVTQEVDSCVLHLFISLPFGFSQWEDQQEIVSWEEKGVFSSSPYWCCISGHGFPLPWLQLLSGWPSSKPQMLWPPVAHSPPLVFQHQKMEQFFSTASLQVPQYPTVVPTSAHRFVSNSFIAAFLLEPSQVNSVSYQDSDLYTCLL